MRDIKLLGYSIKKLCADSQWIEGFGVHQVNYTDGTKEVFLYTEHGIYLVFEKSVGQYTGLNDKNGKEIYEGEICEKDDILYEIIWIDKLAKFCARVVKSESVLIRNMPFPLQQYVIDGTLDCNLKVIGNIYENPELLEVTNDLRK